jgi:hypothetical protein
MGETIVERDSTRIDIVNRNYIYVMCRTCKFYDNGCTKKRMVRKCAEKGLKNKE